MSSMTTHGRSSRGTATATGPATRAANITVPLGATPGLGFLGMRVTVAENLSGAGAYRALLSYGYGETHDYLRNILLRTTTSPAPRPSL
ncbi:MAG: hypothetical protein IPN38_04795 [Flavobacteriales bacterium]|nr:hypothetical protein [Flavobacteriales bacterium]